VSFHEAGARQCAEETDSMNQEFDSKNNVYIDRDSQGHVRQLLHFDAPVRSQAPTPQLVAAEYLNRFGQLLEIGANQIQHLGVAPDTRLTDATTEFRFLGEKAHENGATVAFYQTYFGVPVWESGIGFRCRGRRGKSSALSRRNIPGSQ
jgi:zinc metalloprotease ZmpB